MPSSAASRRSDAWDRTESVAVMDNSDEKNIGFAMLPLQYTEFGTQLTVQTPQSGRVEAVVVRKPFIDPEKEVPKQEVTATAGAKTTSPT